MANLIIKAGTTVKLNGLPFILKNDTMMVGEKKHMSLSEMEELVSHKIQLTCDECGAEV